LNFIFILPTTIRLEWSFKYLKYFHVAAASKCKRQLQASKHNLMFESRHFKNSVLSQVWNDRWIILFANKKNIHVFTYLHSIITIKLFIIPILPLLQYNICLMPRFWIDYLNFLDEIHYEMGFQKADMITYSREECTLWNKLSLSIRTIMSNSANVSRK